MAEALRILAIEPWLGGSHRQLLDGWRKHSRHRVEVLGLAARHWKWRMASGARTLALRTHDLPRPDALWVSDYVDLAQLKAFLPKDWRDLPTLLYFHENQLTYPRSPRDNHAYDFGPAWTNLTSALCADAVAFNSAYHREELLEATRELLGVLPKPRPMEMLAAIEGAEVLAPGIAWSEIPLGSGPPPGAPLRIVFNHRWEYDKAPEVWLQVAAEAIAEGLPLQLVLLGERSSKPPESTRVDLAPVRDHILHRGKVESRNEYFEWLGRCDLAISTARHEFYGMAMLEAAAAGCFCAVPNRLAYPEVLGARQAERFLYGSPEELLSKLRHWASERERFRLPDARQAIRDSVRRHDLPFCADALDARMEALVGNSRPETDLAPHPQPAQGSSGSGRS